MSAPSADSRRAPSCRAPGPAARFAAAIIAGALGLALAGGCAMTPGAQSSGTWDSAPPMRNARAAHAVVVAGDAIYALAGTGAGGRPVLEVERFDGSGWSAEATLP